MFQLVSRRFKNNSRMKFLIFVSVLTVSGQVFANQKVRYDNFQVLRITPKTKKAVESLNFLERNSSGCEFWTTVRGVGYTVYIMIPPQNKCRFNNVLHSKEFDSRVHITNVQELIDNEQPKTEVHSDFGWDRYHTLDEINVWLKNLSATEESVSLINAGKTYEGRDILGVHVSFAPGNENRSVFIEANIHAREWISSAVATFVLYELLTSNDTNVRQVAQSHDWYVIPVFNPDGFEYTHTTNRLWRKTRVPHGECYGADPNRNWGYHFNDGGASTDPCSDTYSGPEPFSEPSTKILSEYISTIGPNLQAYIAFHSFSQLLLIPYSYSSDYLDNYQDLYDVGLKGVASLAQRYGTHFKVGIIADILYVASGISVDWVKGTFTTPITYTYELRDRGRYGFLLPSDQVLPSGQEVLDSLVTIFQEFDKIKR